MPADRNRFTLAVARRPVDGAAGGPALAGGG
jgi:hypothetical protein